jgi:hypothetical protein
VIFSAAWYGVSSILTVMNDELLNACCVLDFIRVPRH